MNNFKRGGQGFGGNRDKKRGFGGGGGRRDGVRPEMHRAVCDDCGKNCEVPFRPSGDKPIFCSNCFEKQGSGKSSDRSPRDFGDRNSRPSFASKPPYQNRTSAPVESYKAQFEELNLKLDKIMKIVASISSQEMPSAKKSSQKKD